MIDAHTPEQERARFQWVLHDYKYCLSSVCKELIIHVISS